MIVMEWDISCEKAQKLLSSYIDRELTYEEERKVALHVDGCLRCARDLEHFRSLKEFLSSLPSEDLPEGFWPQLRQALKREAAGTQILPAAGGLGPALPGFLHGLVHGWRSPFPRGPQTPSQRPQHHRLGGIRLGALVAAAAVPAVLLAVMPLLLHSTILRQEPVGVAPFIRTHALSSYRQPLSDDTWVNYVALDSADDHWWPDLAPPDIYTPSSTGTAPPVDISPVADSRSGHGAPGPAAAPVTIELSAEPWGSLP
ncbi:MAG TPA: hypothetical protein GX506_08165 [Firmicutes bacterium]|nr:hypothetical protein [Bacillota bacterium]